MLTGTSMPKLTSEIGFAAGYTGYLGSGIAYTTSYIKELSIEDGIRNHQYLDRLAALYAEHGVELHRRQPGFLTGTNIPPCIAIAIAVLDCLLAAAQGVTHYGLELAQTLHLVAAPMPAPCTRKTLHAGDIQRRLRACQSRPHTRSLRGVVGPPAARLCLRRCAAALTTNLLRSRAWEQNWWVRRQ